MATVVNARDLVLQSAASRYVPTTVPSINIDYGNIGGVKPPPTADNTTAAVTSGITVGSGGITMTGGTIHSADKTAFNLGSGFFLGYVGGVAVFGIGNSASHYLYWDGTDLRIAGNLDFSYIQNGPAADADNTLNRLDAGITTSGGITLAQNGYIKAGQSWFDQGVGFFLGWDTSAYKFCIGDASYANGPRLRWNGWQLDLVGDAKIDVTSLARFGGANPTSFGTAAVEANYTRLAQAGILAWGGQNGYGIYAVANTGGFGVGIYAEGSTGGSFVSNGTGTAVVAYNSANGRALAVNSGTASIANISLVTSWNSEYWNGVKLQPITTGAATATFTSTNKPGSASANSWLPMYDSSTGNTYLVPIWPY